MKLGLIGCGIWGELILQNLHRLGTDVVVCDTDASRRSPALAAGAQEFCEAIDGMADDVDGWIVATPASSHARDVLAIDELANQAPIFVEKPLTASASEAGQLLDRSGAPVFVMHIWTYHPGIQKLKELVESGLIGKPTLLRSTRANWTSPRRDVDCLTNLAPHDLSIFQYLLGGLPEPRFAVAEKLAGRMVSCVACLAAESGPPCVLEVSNRYGEKRREVRIHGDEGVLVLPDDSSSEITLIQGGGFIVPEEQTRISYHGPPALENELRTFLAYLDGDPEAALWSVEAGAEIVRTIENIHKMACS